MALFIEQPRFFFHEKIIEIHKNIIPWKLPAIQYYTYTTGNMNSSYLYRQAHAVSVDLIHKNESQGHQNHCYMNCYAIMVASA